jgi:hypothetical protein
MSKQSKSAAALVKATRDCCALCFDVAAARLGGDGGGEL